MARLMRAALLAGVLACAVPACAFAQEAQVGIDGGGDAFLYGALLRPEGTAPAPFVLIVPGSGPVDRDGNAGAASKPNTYKLLAEALAAKGIGSLRTDKRGVAGSRAAGKDEADLRFDTYVEDTATWAKFLSLQPRVKCVVLLGHSEGALIAALAAQKVKTCGVIEAAGAGRPAGELLALQLKAAVDAGKLPQDDYDKALHILLELRAGRTVSDGPLRLASLFRPSVQPYLISWFARDPVAADKGLSPLLVLQGDQDAQVGVEDARRLANGNKQAKLVVLPGVDHTLKLVSMQDGVKAAPAAEDTRPLAPDAVAAIADFVLKAR